MTSDVPVSFLANMELSQKCIRLRIRLPHARLQLLSLKCWSSLYSMGLGYARLLLSQSARRCICLTV